MVAAGQVQQVIHLVGIVTTIHRANKPFNKKDNFMSKDNDQKQKPIYPALKPSKKFKKDSGKGRSNKLTSK